MTTYDLIYKGLSDDDREKMRSELEGLMAKAVENSKPRFNEMIGKAAKELCDQVGFWEDWVMENGSQYQFLSTLRNGIWNSILKTKPQDELAEYKLGELIAAWRKNFPDEWAAVVSADAAKQIATLTESLEFERKINQR